MEGLMKLTVRKKLFGGFFGVVGLMVALGVVALIEMGGIQSSATYLGTNTVPSVEIIGSTDTAESDYRIAQLQHVIATTKTDMAAQETEMARQRSLVESVLKQYQGAITNSQDRALWQTVSSKWRAYVSQSAAFLPLSRSLKTTQAMAVLNGPARQTYDSLSADMQKWTALNKQLGTTELAKSRSTYSSAQYLVIAIVIGAALLASAIAFLITRGIVNGVKQVLERMRNLDEHCLVSLDEGLAAVADADLTKTAVPSTTPVERMGGDEIGDLGRTFNAMLTKAQHSMESYNSMRARLADMIGQIGHGSQTVSAASQEMSSTSEEAGRAVGEIATAIGTVAEGAEHQVRLVEQTKHVTDESGEVAQRAHDVAQQGVATVEKADDAMSAVRDSSAAIAETIHTLAGKSEQIGGIVQTITGISEQTNLLALNAAIEAARAGEQGRGFAVVAEEVRKLAEESQGAAATISGIIREIQGETEKAVSVVEDGARRTEEGAAVVGEARLAFEAIGGSVEEIRAKIGEIIGAAGEVAAVAEASSASTEQVSASTEETSASAQQIAASAQELAKTAEGLQALVAQFKTA
jgi:methyl-accepting chemotaxis protein